MSIDVENNNGVCRVVVKDEMTIYTAAAMKTDLMDQLTRCDELEISLQDVSEMDSAGLQLMLLLKSEEQKLKKELRFVKHSQAVIDVLEILDLVAHFGDPIVLPAGEAQ
ncbi:STAS domain-containing protein [Oceanospirillum beijerinckii]|uniref:STAS domain-containing protein n=1 Tax=Oceanospirillum beijerinckii TaxID=64976 RepID=UPI00047F5DB6|nr:STAS domain-containing protein [Oceanospirillum beijerinckii]